MDSNFQLASNLLWIAHPSLQFGVALIIFWRGLHRKFPIFFTYLLVQLANFAIVFPIYQVRNYQAFFYAYWTFAAINLVLGFLVIYEIFLDIFRPYHTLKDLGTVLFKWAGLVMLLVAGVVAAGTAPLLHSPLTQAILTVERCVRVIQCGLVLFLIVFSRYLAISWRKVSCGIALGFGTFAFVELLVVALSSSRSVSYSASSLVLLGTYTISILIWMVYVVMKQRSPQASASQFATQRWDQSLTDIQHPVTDDSLIPLFENMVDRALSRNHDETHDAAKPGIVERAEKLRDSISEAAAHLMPPPPAKNKKV